MRHGLVKHIFKKKSKQSVCVPIMTRFLLPSAKVTWFFRESSLEFLNFPSFAAGKIVYMYRYISSVGKSYTSMHIFNVPIKILSY